MSAAPELTTVAQAVQKQRRLDPSLDFEFRSGSEIALGLPRYFGDAEADVLCMAYDMSDGLGAALWTPHLVLRPYTGCLDVQVLLDHVAKGGKVRAWNVMFEWYVWNLHCVPKYGWPELKIEQLVDSMAEAAALNLPQGLAKCAIALGLPEEHQKSKRGKQLIQLLCVPQPEPVVHPSTYYKTVGAWKGAQTRHASWLAKGGRWLNDPELLQELYDYCLQDVVTEVAVSMKLKKLTHYEQKVWVQTQKINQRGVPIDTDEIRSIVNVVDAEIDRLDAEMSSITGGEVESGSAREQFLTWVNDNAPKRIEILTHELPDGTVNHSPIERVLLEDAQSETIDRALLSPEGLPPTVLRALQIRSAVAQTSTAKLKAMLERVAPDGTLKDLLVYHGASTGRDASRGGVNLQNLANTQLTYDQVLEAHELLGTGDHALAYMMYGDQVMDAAVACVRGVIKAPPGKIFYDADFSSIENRFVAWFADHQDKLDLFRTGLDEYKTIATKIFRIPYEEVTKKQRTFCKPVILGGGFGQGAKGLVDYAAGMGVLMSPEEAQEHTTIYRSDYHKVPKLWYRCGDASIEAVRNPGIVVSAGKHLKLVCKNNFLFMALPSGRIIAWAAPMVENKKTPWGAMKDVVTVMQVDSFTKQWRRDKLIGSSIFQSGVQAAARDALMNGMFAIEEQGYAVVLRVHDELLALVDEGFGSPDEMGRLMCVPPTWCSDLPLAYEAWAAKRYRK